MEDVGNYRQICTLPALYKLYSTIIYNRLYDRLDRAQSEDDGGFRRSYQTLDHLAKYRLLEQKCWEWSIQMWVATVAFQKAFDTIKHKALWTALARFGIEPHHISLLRRPYAEQRATVLTDTKSDVFEIKRGRNEARRPIVQFALQHSTPNGTERRRDTLAKDKKHGHMLR